MTSCSTKASSSRHPLRLAGVAGFVLLMGTVGCGESEPKRRWEPSDHTHPEGRVDPSRMTAPADSPTAGTARERALAALYQAHCARCHGVDGAGNGPERSPAMAVPDFTSSAWQAEADDASMAQVIAQGRAMMPGFGDRISAENIRGLIAYVRAFGPSAAEPAEAAP